MVSISPWLLVSNLPVAWLSTPIISHQKQPLSDDNNGSSWLCRHATPLYPQTHPRNPRIIDWCLVVSSLNSHDSPEMSFPSVIPYANHYTTIITQHINTQNGFGSVYIYIYIHIYIYIYICMYIIPFTIIGMDLIILISLFVSWMRLMSISILTSSIF